MFVEHCIELLYCVYMVTVFCVHCAYDTQNPFSVDGR